jgi:hypothetical protein
VASSHNRDAPVGLMTLATTTSVSKTIRIFDNDIPRNIIVNGAKSADGFAPTVREKRD